MLACVQIEAEGIKREKIQKGEKALKYIASLRQPHVWQATLRSAAAKLAVALFLILLWDRLLNRRSLHPHGVVDTGFFLLFLCFAIHAWLSYLALDGVRPFAALCKNKEKPADVERLSLRLFSLLGFERHSIRALDESCLEEEELVTAGLGSSIFAAVFFLVPSLVANVV